MIFPETCRVSVRAQIDVEARAHGEIVERINLQRVVLLGDDNARRLIRLCAAGCELSFDTVDGQAWQKQAEDTPPVR